MRSGIENKKYKNWLKICGSKKQKKKYYFDDYLTDKELSEIKEKYNRENFKIKFRWCTTNWHEKKGLEISLAYLVSI